MNEHDSESLPGAEDSSGFDLVAPGTNIRDFVEVRKQSGAVDPPKPRVKSDESLKEFSWRGFEEAVDEVDPDPPINYGEKKKLTGDDGMDMTPMVDVTFLLLIFFMITASFTVQKSLDTPHAKIDDPSNVTAPEEDEPLEYVEVIIDQNNTYYVTTRGEAEVEAANDRDMSARVRSAKDEYGAVKLIITAHVDSFHSKTVTVWDTGIACGFDKVEFRTTELNY